MAPLNTELPGSMGDLVRDLAHRHIDSDLLARYVYNHDIGGAEKELVEQHLRLCPDCRDDVDTARTARIGAVSARTSTRTLGVVAVALVILALFAAPIIMMLSDGEQIGSESGPCIAMVPRGERVEEAEGSGPQQADPEVTSPPRGEVGVSGTETTAPPVAPPAPSASDLTSVEITITSPTEGSKVNYLERIDGTVSDPSLTVLVVVTTFEDSTFWVQNKAQVTARKADDSSGKTIGKWYSVAFFGRSHTQDHGKRFAVMAIATPDPEHLPPGAFLGPVPRGLPQSDPVIVVRK
jgi:hypothetical protein